MTIELRYDLAQLREPEEHGSGFLRVDAYVTRVGVFEYVLPDGTVRRELRPPEEVFDEASIDSLRGIPITDGHPDEPLNPDNVAKYMIGAAGDVVERSDGYLRVPQTIHRREGLDSIKSGRRQESCGYFVELEDAQGTWIDDDGLVGPAGAEYEFDAIQRNIEYNHIALVDRGRAGPRVRARVDAARQLPAFRADSIDDDWQTRIGHEDGPGLNGVLLALVARATGEERSRSDVIQEMAEAAGITTSTVYDHLTDAIACPPRERLEGFADVLGTSADRLIDLAEADGCEYSRDDDKDDNPTSQTRTKIMASVKIDGVTYDGEVPAEKVGPVVQENENLKGRIDTAESQAQKAEEERDEIQEKYDDLKSEHEQLEGKYDTLKSEAEARGDEDDVDGDLQEATQERIELLVIGNKLNIDGLDNPLECEMSNAELQREIIKEANPNARLDGKSDDYVRGVFEQIRDSTLKSDSAFKDFANTLHPANNGPTPQNPAGPTPPTPRGDEADVVDLETNYHKTITGTED